MQKFLYVHIFSLFLGIYLGVRLLGCVVVLCLTFEGLPGHFPKWLHHFHSYQQCNSCISQWVKEYRCSQSWTPSPPPLHHLHLSLRGLQPPSANPYRLGFFCHFHTHIRCVRPCTFRAHPQSAPLFLLHCCPGPSPQHLSPVSLQQPSPKKCP